jgi:hypothetical protein
MFPDECLEYHSGMVLINGVVWVLDFVHIANEAKKKVKSSHTIVLRY